MLGTVSAILKIWLLAPAILGQSITVSTRDSKGPCTKEVHVRFCKDWSQLHYQVDMNLFSIVGDIWTVIAIRTYCKMTFKLSHFVIDDPVFTQLQEVED